MRVTPIRGACATRVLCLSCRAVFGRSALPSEACCPVCSGFVRFLAMTGSFGPFRLLDAPGGIRPGQLKAGP